MNLVLFEPSEVTADGLVTVHDARATHLLRVLKVAPGDTVRVGVIEGAVGVGTVTAIGTRSGHAALRPRRRAATPAGRSPIALPRPKVMRRLWAQLAALGVGRIILTNAERVERNYFDTHVLALECYRPLLVKDSSRPVTRAPGGHDPPPVQKARRGRTGDAERSAPVRLVAHPDVTTTIRDGSGVATTVSYWR